MTSKRKKHRRKFIFIIIALIFAYALFYNSDYSLNTSTEAEVKASVDSFFKELKAGNVDNALKYARLNDKYSGLDSKLEDKESKNLLNTVLSKINYKIEDISVKDSLATVKLKIETVDLFSFYNKYSKELSPLIKKYISGNESQRLEVVNEIKSFLNDKVEKDLKNGLYEKFEGTTKINLVMKDGKWVIDAKDDLMYYLTGKMSFLFK